MSPILRGRGAPTVDELRLEMSAPRERRAGFTPRALVFALFATVSCASPPSSDDGDAATDGAFEGHVGFDAPSIDFPDSSAGRVAAALGGCTSGELTGCHGHASSAGLSLIGDPVSDFDQLIGRPSTERPDLLRVRPFAPQSSWMFLKLSNARDAGVDTAMPLGTAGNPALAAEVEAWINQGAPNPFIDAGLDATVDTAEGATGEGG